MNTDTLYSLDTTIRTNNKGKSQMTKFVQAPEIRMFIHDLRNIVQTIVGSVDTLQMALQEHAVDLAMKSLARLKQNTDLTIDMLGNFGEDSQLDNEHDTECDVAREIQRLLDSLAPLLVQNGITIHQNVASPAIAAISKTDFNRLLLNILLNAIEATSKPDAPITIAASTISDESVQITVHDNGDGINEEKLTNIFDEGYTTKTGQGNKGFGLVIVKQLLEVYHGTMRVQSGSGRGTKFTVWLPRTKKNRGNSH